MSTIQISDPNLSLFYTQNQDFDILKFNLSDESELAKLNWQELDKSTILEPLKKYQRLLRLYPDATVAAALLNPSHPAALGVNAVAVTDTQPQRSLDSAHKITTLSQTQFIKEYGPKFGENGVAKAKQVYLAAANAKSQVMHLFANVASLVDSRHFRYMNVNHVSEDIPRYFESLSSYQEIFGSLNYCECTECKSIFGPAAYLVDLLRIIDKAITVPNTTKDKDNIPDGLKLFDRRPDLAKIQLTCANTNDTVPYLQIVNQILEQTVGNAFQKEGKLLNNNVFLTLANTYYPFNLPFNLPLQQIRIYLNNQKIDLSDIYQALNPTDFPSHEYLGLSIEQYNNLKPTTDSNKLPDIVSKNYGLTITSSNLAGLERLDKDTEKNGEKPKPNFIAQTGLSRQQVEFLLSQNLSVQEFFDVSWEYNLSGKGTKLTLKQVSDRVTGNYDLNNGELQGTLKRNESSNQWIFRGHWLEGTKQPPDGAGRFEFTFDLNGSGFTGQWSKGYGGNWEANAWNGTRDASTPPTGGIIPHHFFINKVLADKQYLNISINTSDPNNQYEQINNLSLATLDTVNRFVRLAQALGWSYNDLDWVLTSLGATEIDAPTLSKLAKIKKLSDKYNFPLDSLTALWFDIKTIGIGNGEYSEAPFDVIFNNPALIKHSANNSIYHPQIETATTSYVNPLYQDKDKDVLDWIISNTKFEQFKKEKLQANQADDIPSETNLQKANAIVASIPASGDDIKTVAIAAFGELASIKLSVPNLSLLYRHTMLPKQLCMRVPEYVLLLHLLGMTQKITISGKEVIVIKSILTPDEVIRVAESVDWIRDSGLTIYDVDYICNKTPNDQTPSVYVNTGYDPENILAFLKSLQPFINTSLLQKDDFVSKEIPQAASEAYYEILLQQGFINNLGLIVKTITKTEKPDFSIVSQIAPGIANPNEDQINYICSKAIKQQQEQSEHFAEQLGSFFGVKGELMSVLIDGINNWLDESNVLANCLWTVLFDIPASDVLTDQELDKTKLPKVFQGKNTTLSSNLQITPQATTAWTIQDVDNNCIYYAYKNTTDQITFYKPIETDKDATIPEIITTFLRSISQYLVLKQKLGLSIAELSSVFQYPQTYGINTDNKPVKLALSNVRDIYYLKKLIVAFGDRKNDLVNYFAKVLDNNPPATAMLMTQLSAITDWNQEQCGYLCQKLFSAPGTCKTVEGIFQLKQVFDIGNVLGVNIYFLEKLSQVARVEMTNDNWQTYTNLASQLLQSVKAKTTSEAWPTTYKQLNDPIEEQKRNALLNLAIWQLGKQYEDITDPRKLYEYLLIDVEMGGCAEISYIKEALNAAQLYLQRCRLNLERNVTISTDDLPNVWWEWLMNYRIWEANRQIFLYPENYIDPTLRKSKTSLFRELENTLLQGEVTKEKVEEAYKTYLDKFAQLAKLKYVDAYHATVHSKEKGAIDTLFLFARTQEEPYNFYYIAREKAANCDNQDAYLWTEWQKIDITINANTITPVYAFNKLFVFWVEIKKVRDKDQSASNGNDAEKVIGLYKDVYKATIKYSFYNFSGNWVQPQILVNDKVIDVESSTNIYGPFDPNLFDTENPYWHKVAALTIVPNSYPADNQSHDVTEKISLFYGSLINVNALDETRESPTPSPKQKTDGDDIADFKEIIIDSNEKWNQMKAAEQSGYFPIQHVITLNSEMEEAFLLNHQEYILLESNPSGDKNPPTFKVGILGTSLAINPTDNPLYDSYVDGMGLEQLVINKPAKATWQDFLFPPDITEDEAKIIFSSLQSQQLIGSDGTVKPNAVKADVSLISIAIQKDDQISRRVRNKLFKLYCGTPVLFANTARKNTAIISVKNQPGWFLFSNKSETFLISSTSQYLDTKQTPIVGTFQKVTEALTLEEPYGFVRSDSFADVGGIDSKTIFDTLLSQHLIDSKKVGDQDEGLVDIAKTRKLSADLIQIAIPQLTLEQAQEVKDIMLASGPSGLSYVSSNFTSNDNVYTLNFTTERITTSAIHNLSLVLFTEGIDGLLSLRSQQAPENIKLPFERLKPSPVVTPPDIAFGDQVSFSGPYGNYFWELFFHGPMLVANMLNNNQQFREAERWLQYIFNPTLNPIVVTPDSFVTDDISKEESETIFGYLQNKQLGQFINDRGEVTELAKVLGLDGIISATQLASHRAQEVLNVLLNKYLETPTTRYWQFLPFRNHTLESLKDQLQNCSEIAAYNNDPFDPHAIARLRIGAYEKAVVMKYINNLLDWGDYEFAQYTWESITAATMLYVYAYDLLGPKPVDLGSCEEQFPVTFTDIQARYLNSKGSIPQFLIDMEHFVGNGGAAPSHGGKAFNDLDLYFCVPENEQFTVYWDRVQDRLYKIRHCLNIKGQKQPLPLFQPPIDPMALVRAAAADNNVLDVATQLQPNIPNYRFSYMIERAKNITSTVIQFGQSLLSALEKNDAEALALLYSSQSGVILTMTTMVKQKQIEELQDQLAALQQNLQSAQYRYDHYKTLISNGINAAERTNLLLSAEVLPLKLGVIGFHGISIGGYVAPVVFGFSDGDMKLGDAIQMGANISNTIAEMLQQSASIAAIVGEQQRRQEEWEFQQQLAQDDVDQITQQIEVHKVSIAISQQELAIHKKQIEQSDQQENFLKSKFTNQELYQWMISRLSTVYFQTYRIALEMALAAQTAYYYELERDDQYITFSYWDSLHKGLLAGEGLIYSLLQLENAYVENNVRRLEIEKTISLRQQFPEAFVGFKWGNLYGDDKGQKGQLQFTLSQQLFDFDFPSHYCRKIKSISISIPAVIGPYQNINATLTQNSNAVVLKPDKNAVDYLLKKMMPELNKKTNKNSGSSGNISPPPSGTVRENWVPNQQIATSTGIDDTGMFALNFEDERYLPFEGTGAVSSWTLNMPPETNRINFDSLSDVIVKVRYSAKDGGSNTYGTDVKNLYKGAGIEYQNLKAKSIELNQAFASSWYQMFNTLPANNQQKISFPITDDIILPNLEGVTPHAVLLQLEVANAGEVQGEGITLEVGQTTKGAPPPFSKSFDITNNFGELTAEDLSRLTTWKGNGTQWSLIFDVSKSAASALVTSKTLADGTILSILDSNKLLNVALIIVYSAKPF